MQYVAFLRGINVGGNKKVPIAELKKTLEKTGYENVKTLLASGNVAFETKITPPKTLEKHLAEIIEKKFGFPVPVLIRTVADLQKLAASNPFTSVKDTSNKHLYITFLADKPKSTFKIPYTSPDKSFTILCATDTEVCSFLDRNIAKTPDAMSVLEKTYGKNVTTRNWNTIQKLLV